MHVGIIPFIPGLIYKSKWYKLLLLISLVKPGWHHIFIP